MNKAAGDKVTEQLRQQLEPDRGYLLAVSGGIDSVVLLHASVVLRESLKIDLEVAHVDHGLRPDSSEDARFVSDLARASGIRCHSLRLEREVTGEGLEAWGRERRYDFFASILHERGLDSVLTAHHANDRAETVLMRFLANREPSSIHAVDLARKIRRPLLDLRRSDLEAYAKECQLTFREDPSNIDQAILRNRYRHSILPFLERELSTDLVRVLAQRAESLEDDATALELLAREKLEGLGSLKAGDRDWLRALSLLLKDLPPALAWRAVERVLAERYGTYVGRRTSLRVLNFIQGAEGAIEIPGGHRIRRTGGGLEFS